MSWATVDELHELNAAATEAAVREVLAGRVGYYGPGALWHPPASPAPSRAKDPRRSHNPRAQRPPTVPRHVHVRPPAPIRWLAPGVPASAADANRWLAECAETKRITATMLRAIGWEETSPGVFAPAFDGRGIS